MIRRPPRSTRHSSSAESVVYKRQGDCGTGNSIGKGGNGVTATGSYAFDSGFSLAAGLSSATTSAGILTKEGTDSYGIEAAYTADSYGLAVAYVSDDNAGSPETTSWGNQRYLQF